ncbi:MAG: hypothetical protein QW753_07075 [Thermofilum sp.]
MSARVVRNEEVSRIVAFIPPGHTHVRLILELGDQTLILQEATVAAIVRAYISITTHPLRRAVELAAAKPSARKPGYAEHQLLETGKPEEEVLREAYETWSKAQPR